MRIKSLMVWVALPLLLFLLMGHTVTKRFPPYELGLHSDVVEAETNRSNVDGPHVGNCPVYPKDNVWNTPIDKLEKSSKSDAYIESIGADKKLKADWGSDMRYGMPFTEIPPGTPRSKVSFQYHDDSDLGNYPIPANPPIEGGADSKGDRHIVFIDTKRCILYELFNAYQLGELEWKAGSGIKIDLTSNQIRDAGKGSSDASGMAMFPGLVRYEEVAAGEINHAIRFTIPHTQAAYIWPARHKASADKDPNVAPMGARFRLKASVDISKYSKPNQVILKALKRYGMFVADNGAPMFITGVPDKRWDDYDLKKLGEITAGDFEVVDEGDFGMLENSGRVDPLAKQ